MVSRTTFSRRKSEKLTFQNFLIAFDESEMQWFYDRGCELIKVCAEPGDLILWDSAYVSPFYKHSASRILKLTFSFSFCFYSTIHQNCPPFGKRDRIVTYVCMGPAHLMTDEDVAVRKLAFNGGFGTVSPLLFLP